ncbi:hypothetical protein Bca52824_016051 [Brassica carinata]|uniref:Uncharacterized protein n=1 Tax=Brassica carinata TaxID=52824 RepID=A0A8X8B5Z6_BRACI|nr:hypothetical protein Bca52824_016051 [Brassica carinata]
MEICQGLTMIVYVSVSPQKAKLLKALLRTCAVLKHRVWLLKSSINSVKQLGQLKEKEEQLKKQRKDEKPKTKAMKMMTEMKSESNGNDCDISRITEKQPFLQSKRVIPISPKNMKILPRTPVRH